MVYRIIFKILFTQEKIENFWEEICPIMTESNFINLKINLMLFRKIFNTFLMLKKSIFSSFIKIKIWEIFLKTKEQNFLMSLLMNWFIFIFFRMTKFSPECMNMFRIYLKKLTSMSWCILMVKMIDIWLVNK